VPESPPYPYHLGTEYPVMPAAPIAEHCLSVAAGAVTLVVEARDLALDLDHSTANPDGPTFDDFGASLHVLGASDGVERLRFDCFDKEPHYHYIRPDETINVIVRLDDIAEGDPIEWTVGRLRDRLPAMLEHARAGKLADEVRADMPSLLDAIDTVKGMLEEAQRRTSARRAASASASA
jgi:hypothetical protein